jgi:hypothetical protein
MWSQLQTLTTSVRLEKPLVSATHKRRQQLLIWVLLGIIIILALRAGYNAVRLEHAQQQLEQCERLVEGAK